MARENNAAEDDITFNIDGAGPHRIILNSNLPDIVDDGIIIDGLTQNGASCGQLTTGIPHDLRLVIDGNAAATTHTFVVGANSNTIRGLSIVNSGNLAISFNSSSTDSTADCLYLGMEADGTTANSAGKSFGLSAIQVEGASNTTLNNNLISGNDSTEFTDGIRIVSNASGVNITGNIIGLDETGTLIRGNGDRGIITTGTPSNIVIGGLTAETRNIVSGNAFDGIRFRTLTSGATVLGNYIGFSYCKFHF